MRDVDELVRAASHSLFKPESLQDVRDRLARIDASPCRCADTPHENALHDLANDDVPVLLKVVDQLALEVERLHSWDGLMSLLDEHYPEDIFPTLIDGPDRDPGPRIVSMLRTINRIREATK